MCKRDEKENLNDIKKVIIRIIIVIFLVVLSKILQVNDYIKFIITIVAYIICSYEVLINAVKSIFTEFSLDENVLMTVASIAAFIIGETHEAIAIIIFYQIGEMFEDFSMDKSRSSIRSLVDMKSDFANIYILSTSH